MFMSIVLHCASLICRNNQVALFDYIPSIVSGQIFPQVPVAVPEALESPVPVRGRGSQ